MKTTQEYIALFKVTVRILNETVKDLIELWTTGNITRKD